MKAQLIGIALAVASAQAATCSTVLSNTDYIGNDITTTTQTKYDACCDDCNKTLGCSHYVWNSYTSTCILKGGVPGAPVKVDGAFAATLKAGPSDATCSAVKKDTDYFGNDLTTTSRNSYDACCADCSKAKGCTHYVWNSHTSTRGSCAGCVRGQARERDAIANDAVCAGARR
ncbi:hypothetical protein SDRG_12901 [Saprolegnia diclina VS20]|uniref:Apple domain-containing protein n=1 Tax=Saprolegnia diclina (strain VS20) TaxID=1156394 RepID=T0PVB7_SAPDV|nr:hypothetical protein SDRG_12901 [Saprolegnia diclina VS20]EQC29439.1 hypothetical protein SDRG_12901 [Saprolegnia diclina VS20]|eukprot:XP_008617206.1 hypothetical protein SDRG_12901 [Saprolegnia diclina VS20]